MARRFLNDQFSHRFLYLLFFTTIILINERNVFLKHIRKRIILMNYFEFFLLCIFFFDLKIAFPILLPLVFFFFLCAFLNEC